MSKFIIRNITKYIEKPKKIMEESEKKQILNQQIETPKAKILGFIDELKTGKKLPDNCKPKKWGINYMLIKYMCSITDF